MTRRTTLAGIGVLASTVVGAACVSAASTSPTAGSPAFSAALTAARATTSVPVAMPSSASTGVPTGRQLHSSGSLTITRPGTVIDGYDVNGTITVHADNVTIRNTRVTSASYWPIGNTGRNLLVQDVEINGQGCSVGIMGSDMTIQRADIHGCADGVRAGSNTVVRDSYIHGLRVSASSHNDGIQSTGGSNIVILHNTILNPRSQTSAILLKADFSPINNALVVGNLLDGGCYTVYAVNGAFSTTGVTVAYNRFGPDALYGLFVATAPVTWTGNVSTTGAAVTAGTTTRSTGTSSATSGTPSKVSTAPSRRQEKSTHRAEKPTHRHGKATHRSERRHRPEPTPTTTRR